MLESKIGSTRSSESRNLEELKRFETGEQESHSIFPMTSVVCSFAELHKDCSRAAACIGKVRAMLSWRIERIPG